MDKINLDEVAKSYDLIQEIWPINDKWHTYNHQQIVKSLTRSGIYSLSRDSKILNAGSGGESYFLSEDSLYHVDIAASKIIGKKHFYVGSIEKLPFEDCFFDAVICVGEVINYCDADKVIAEFSRVLRAGGLLILEYESTNTLELIFRKEFNSPRQLWKTFYQGHPEWIWYYSDEYLMKTISSNGFAITKNYQFHILSIFIYRLTQNSNFSSYFAIFDILFRLIPWIRQYGSNTIISARKD